MKKWTFAGLVVAVLAVITFIAVRMMMPPPADLDLVRSKASAGGTYMVTIAPEAEPIEQGALHSWLATVTTADGDPVEDAQLTVDGGMPQHGHGLPTAPQSSAHLGEGRYRIDGVRFNMGGWWVLSLDVSSASGSDTVEFNIML
ncbi:FixH family protein [Mesorhizobium sp. CAU 1741]|uniref:FixH family protein n=1 Tax=Mesorhizobium sp. CAU 1741 TaxID=3140366 RepID=UPI00325AC952